MRPVQSGAGRQMCQAYVVPKEEILSNPAFADLRLREGLGEGTSGVSLSLSFELKYFLVSGSYSSQLLLPQAYRRKSSNCQRSSSVESGQNNSSANQKKCKRGVVTDFTNNNLGGEGGNSQSEHKTLVQKFREFLAKRETHSLYIWPPDSGLRWR